MLKEQQQIGIYLVHWYSYEWNINLKPIKLLTSMTIFPLGVFVQQ